MPTTPSSPNTPDSAADTAAQTEIAIDSRALFQGRREIAILHNQDRYILRITRQGKLILNK